MASRVTDHFTDHSEVICFLSRQEAPVNSRLFETSWSNIKESSSLTIWKRLNSDHWQYLMKILDKADVSNIQHLVLELPSVGEPSGSMDIVETIHGDFPRETVRLHMQLGRVLGTGRFSALNELRIFGNDSDGLSVGLVFDSLALAFKSGRLAKLERLSLPACDVNAICAIFESLIGGGMTHLVAFSIVRRRTALDKGSERRLSQVLKAVLQHGCFKRLRHLDLSNGILDGNDGWRVFVEAIRSGLLPSLKSLRLSKSWLSQVNLTDLVPLLCSKSFENLIIDGCRITSLQLRDMVAVIMRTTEAGLALKYLDLHDNRWEDDAIDDLVEMAKSDRLPKLQTLDLRMNTSIGSKALLHLIEIIRLGHLPSLRRLNLVRNLITNSVAEAIVRAYFENEAMTVKIDIDWSNVEDLSLRAKVSEYRDRNLRLVDLKDNHSADLEDVVPVTSAKVFLCGYPEVGKTRLRKTLVKHHGRRTKWKWETRPEFIKEPRTRGIELTRIAEKNPDGDQPELVVWDLAGQEEYHVLHGTFISDLGFAGGKATTFALVFRAPYRTEVREELLSWLRFGASSSLKCVRRHVVIVLNCFDGKQCTEADKLKWIALIGYYARLFSDLLDIHPIPFIMDVRATTAVKPLKDHLFDHARKLLQDVKVPRVCFELLKDLKGWSTEKNKKTLPIFAWEAFQKGSQIKHKRHRSNEKDLKISASYLHEMGEIIYFDGQDLTIQGSGCRSVVVPDPEWFCKQVVGQLLLPKELLEGESSMEVNADGSITVDVFKNFFEHLLSDGTDSDDVIAMLEQVGLCYRKGEDEIIVPALIREDNYRSICWDGQGFGEVMGRCLSVANREKFALPMTLFRRLQVELAQDPSFGGRGDSEYKAGRSFSNFKLGEHLVLIQFDCNKSNPTDDRIDILVKCMTWNQRDPTQVRLAQIERVCEIMKKLEALCVSCCPGLTYDIQVIQPWPATQKNPKMIERKMMCLREIEDQLIKGHRYSSWMLNGAPLEFKNFLSESELKDILRMTSVAFDDPDDRQLVDEIETPRQTSRGFRVSGQGNRVMDDPVSMLDAGELSGRLAEDSAHSREDPEEGNATNGLNTMSKEKAVFEYENDDQGRLGEMLQEFFRLVINTVHEEGQLTRHHVGKSVREDGRTTRQLVDKRLERMRELMLEVQAQQAFSLEEKERSVPRYMFLTRVESKAWIRLQDAFRSTFQLHLLCESHFSDGFLHEVDGQEGIELRKPKEWLVNISPWLHWSLKVAVMVVKTVGNLYVPGAFNVIPDVDYLPGDSEKLAREMERAATLLEEDEEEGSNDHRKYRSATDPVDLKMRMIAEQVVQELRNEVGPAVFDRKIGLKRVLLRPKVHKHEGSSRQAEDSVLWMCFACYKNYRAHPEQYTIHDI